MNISEGSFRKICLNALFSFIQLFFLAKNLHLINFPAKMKDKKTQEEIIAGFQALRAEQRSIAAKINELQQDLNEHKIVIETLDGVDADRKCFRSV